MPSRVGITVEDVRSVVLEGLPLFDRQGQPVSSAFIQLAIDAAEEKVSLDLDVLIGVREVRCIHDQTDPDDDDDDAIILPPFQKPRNWFAGDRWGDLPLPKLPAKRVKRVTLFPYGFTTTPIEVPVQGPNSRARLNRKSVQFVPGMYGMLFPPTSAGLLPAMQFADGQSIPGAIEVVYDAGLSARDLRQMPLLKMMILHMAGIMTLGLVQIRIGNGLQKEAGSLDGMMNAVELAKRDSAGPLGGEIRRLEKTYQELLRSLQATQTFQMIWL